MGSVGKSGCNTGTVDDNRLMPARLSAFVTWALVAAGLVFWGMRFGARPIPVPANTQIVSAGERAGVRGDLTRLLGASPVVVAPIPTPVADNSRFLLLGVVAPRQTPNSTKRSLAGVALIAVDGKPPRPYAVGSQLDGDIVLQSISRRGAMIGPAQGPPTLVLELPPPAMPATGALPSLLPVSPVSPSLPPVDLDQPFTQPYEGSLPTDVQHSDHDMQAH